MRPSGWQIWFCGAGVVVMAMLGASSAGAQQLPPGGDPQPAPPSVPAPPVEPGLPPATPPPLEIRTQPEYWKPRTVFGAAVLLGGGVDNFVDDGVNDMTGLGGAWSLRLVSGTREPLGFELSYFGDARDITGPGITQDDYVLRNGVEGALRLHFPFVRGSGLIEPFALAGLGWSRYSLINESSSVTFMKSSDNQLSIPVGAGLAASYRGFMFDARFTYRMAAGDDMFGTRDMAAWNVGASLGAEF
jgi:hypothetical protein